MGLDMYLSRKTYVKQWAHTKPEKQYSVTVTRGGQPTSIKPERITEVTEEIMYWRKANAIHKWFVDNVQGGEDDCGEYRVSLEQLEQLRDLCLKVTEQIELEKGIVTNGHMGTPEGWKPIHEDGEVITNPSVAATLLPTASGFFFGSTDYDQWYAEEVRETAETLTEILREPNDGDFYYRASW